MQMLRLQKSMVKACGAPSNAPNDAEASDLRSTCSQNRVIWVEPPRGTTSPNPPRAGMQQG